MAIDKHAVLVRKNTILGGGLVDNATLETTNTIIPFDNMSIELASGETDPENVVLTTREKTIEIVNELKNTIFDTVYTAYLNNGETLLPTAEELNLAYDLDDQYLEVEDLNGNIIHLTRNPDPVDASQKSMNDGEGILIIIQSTGIFEEAGFQKDTFLIDVSKNKLPGQLEKVEVDIKDNTNRISNLEGKQVALINNNSEDLATSNEELVSKTLLDTSINDSLNEYTTTAAQDITDGVQNGRITQNEQDIIVDKQGILDNKNEIAKIESGSTSLSTDKQNVNLDYKPGTTVEEQIKANEDENIDSKNREDNFVKKDDGEMAVGYQSSGNKTVIPKDEFDTAISKKDTEIQDLNAQLAKKADVTDLGQKPLIYIPGQGASETDAVTPVIPTENGNTLTYTFDATDWQNFKTRVDPDGKLLINGIQADIYIKDNNSTTYPGKESYNNGSATKITFGTDADAQWSLSDGNLVIITNNQNSDITRTIRQITFLVEGIAGALVDQTARDAAAENKSLKQNKEIDIIGINSKNVEGALEELKNAKDALEDKTQEQSFESGATKFTTNVEIGGELKTNTIKVNGQDVALKNEILDIIVTDENNTTVKEVRDAIDISLNSISGRKSVIFNHSSTPQAKSTFNGYIERITNDPIENTIAYFGESTFNKFTTSDDGRPAIWQLFLNIIGWKAWQKTLPAGDIRLDGRDEAAIDAMDQDGLNALPILQARRDTELNVKNEHVLTDSVEDDSLSKLEILVNGGL